MAKIIIDFHTHTYHSPDSLMKPEKILRIAREKGLNGIVICDHNTIKGGLEAQGVNSDKDFLVIVGAEIATDAGDVTGIFLKQEINSTKFSAVAREIKKQGGKVILNHPYKGHDLSKVDFSLVDFVEGFNSRVSAEMNQKAIQLAQQYKIPIIAGSDSHVYKEIGNCWTTFESMKDMIPIDHKFSASRPIYGLISQYIKAWKRKKAGIFISATAVFLKRWLAK